MKITVLGSGGWGTALALLLLDNGNEVTLWSFDPAEAEVLRTTRENPMLKGVALPDSLAITTEFDTIPSSEIVVMATPSFAVRATARKAAPFLREGTIVVSVAKGIEKDTAKRLTEIIEEEKWQEITEYTIDTKEEVFSLWEYLFFCIGKVKKYFFALSPVYITNLAFWKIPCKKGFYPSSETGQRYGR